ncbi:hypothetical protein [Salidesulfovibrio onnuriiensis]|uniref:hypothetical protein n=1 Tax=Salidesulfovibrio onnuriiensis TaxID=2583823 RepID=UPI0011CA9C1A|nr:hypothetical protein [Salidesulfovibrio onnuriiensis]
MSQFKESDLPLEFHHGELLTLSDGTTVRFESNGEAKDIMLNDGFAPAATLFPGNEFCFEAHGDRFCMTCTFEDSVTIAKS